ncbi:MAG: hypothetical protein DRN88_05525 [Candidatus Hydrothermarchaeota archaeon]|nr:MAG: hypothetical protein DRN88_05525 [Candidatus Hydrothermarchaeota archaeon]
MEVGGSNPPEPTNPTIGGEALASDKYRCKICGKVFTPVKAMYHIMYEHNKDDHNVWLEPVKN